MPKIIKRLLIILIIATAALAGTACVLVDKVGGAYQFQPEDMAGNLSENAQTLIERAYAGIDKGEQVDFHMHIVGIGTHSDARVNEKLLSWAHPIHRLKTAVYLSGAGITDLEQADKQYVDRLVRLIRLQPKPGKYRILAFDHNYNDDGTVNIEHSEFYVPNEYVFELATKYPDIFIPTISVHPYRKDALAEVEKWAKRGARYIKWLPNAMNIDAADPRLDSYYALMKKYDMVLLTHVGEEQAVEADEAQKLGNPLRFRRALDSGIKIIMAHVASLGEDEDLDHPDKPMVPSNQLFLRLMDEPKYKTQLFADLSATTQFNRLPGPLTAIMERIDLFPRLVNGSDYPLPSINIVIRTRDLVKHGFITEQEREGLNEIYDYNPLLFDFVLKRTLKLPGTQVQLPATVFMQNPALPTGLIPGVNQ